MHYLAVLSFIILCMRVLNLNPQLFIRKCYVPFLENSIFILIMMHTVHSYNTSIISVGITLAFKMLFLVWQPVIL